MASMDDNQRLRYSQEQSRISQDQMEAMNQELERRYPPDWDVTDIGRAQDGCVTPQTPPNTAR